MADKIKETKKQEVEIRATPRAFEKIKEIFNGSRKKFFQFTNNITLEEIKEKKFEKLVSNGEDILYYEQCKNIYVVFTINSETSITIVDILTPIEFSEIFK